MEEKNTDAHHFSFNMLPIELFTTYETAIVMIQQRRIAIVASLIYGDNLSLKTPIIFSRGQIKL
jgi:hypothetical protein